MALVNYGIVIRGYAVFSFFKHFCFKYSWNIASYSSLIGYTVLPSMTCFFETNLADKLINNGRSKLLDLRVSPQWCSPQFLNIFSLASFQIRHFLSSRPWLYAILVFLQFEFFWKSRLWGGERQPTPETGLSCIPTKNDIRKSAKVIRPMRI